MFEAFALGMSLVSLLYLQKDDYVPAIAGLAVAIQVGCLLAAILHGHA